MKQKLLERVYGSSLLPVVAIENSEDAVELGKTFLNAGVCLIEITFRTEAAAEAIEKLAGSGLDITVGAGTVLTTEMAEKAVRAGAEFLVTPGFDEEVIKWAVEREVPIFPGVTSPGDITKAMRFGLDVVKFFPSESIGGIKMLKSLSGPFKNMRFIPTGGISQKNIGDYMNLGNVLACGGSWICPTGMISGHEYDKIYQLTAEAESLIHGFSLQRVDIRTEEKNDTAPDFAANMIGTLKTAGKGSRGRITVGVRNVERAAAYLKICGCSVDEGSVVKEGGETEEICLNEEIGGFAVYLRKQF